MSKLKPYSAKFEEVARPPDGVPWIWLSRDLLKAAVWRRRSIHCIRLIDFLLLEHMANGGKENGHLVAPWDQLERHGVGRRYIAAAIDEAEAFKLIAVIRGGLRAHNRAAMNRYRLTFLVSCEKDDNGKTLYWLPAGDEWRKVNAVMVEEFLTKRPAWNAQKKKIASAHRVTETGNTVSPFQTRKTAEIRR